MNLSEIHQNCIDVENNIVYIHGDSLVKDEEPGVDYRMASTFIKNMQIMKAKKVPVTIHMNTIGGDWNYGMAMYDCIKTYPYKTTVIGYSWVRSMSSIILQAATERVLMPNCSFMMHFGTGHYSGHYLTAQAEAEQDKITERKMCYIYAEKMMHSEFRKEHDYEDEEKLIKHVILPQIREKGDWWLAPQEAVYYGLADKVAQ
jgi:ATP-dependent protease ClpP protease subunit